MSSATTYIDVNAPVSDEIRSQIAGADNNALIVRLMFTTNHLSRWLTPIHDPNRLERSLYRGEPTAKDLVIALRNEEQRVYPRLYLIATQTRANLDTLPEWQESPQTVERDAVQPAVVLMAQFRRLRQSTCGLLRSLPDDAWGLIGRSRREPDVTIRQLAEQLAVSDYRYLRALDQTLDQVGARDGLAEIQKTHLDELLTLVPEHLSL
jgi:hypothetical protein